MSWAHVLVGILPVPLQLVLGSHGDLSSFLSYEDHSSCSFSTETYTCQIQEEQLILQNEPSGLLKAHACSVKLPEARAKEERATYRTDLDQTAFSRGQERSDLVTRLSCGQQ